MMEGFYTWLEKLIPNVLLMHLTVSLGIILVTILGGRLLNLIVRVVIKPFTGKTKTTLDDKIILVIEKFSNRIFIVLALYLAIRYFVNSLYKDVRIKEYVGPTIYNFIVNTAAFLNDLLYIVTVLFVIYALYNLFRVILDFYLEKRDVQRGEKSAYDLIPFVKKLILVVLFTIGLLIILFKFNVNISGIVLSLGIGSLAVALAAQETLSNMIAGFVILVDRPFRLGDRIRLPSGET
jgi:MscS family membrane protein